jgi:hypothetical protein
MISFALLIRSIPAFAELLGHILRFVLRWSYRVYNRLFLSLNPSVQNQLGIDITEMPYRMILSIMISIILGLLIVLILRIHFYWLFMIGFGLHGAMVAWLWTDFFEPQGLHIGENIR